MFQWKRLRVIWMLVALLAMLTSRPAEATTPQTIRCGGWQIVASPNLTTFYNALSGVAAVSTTDVWAVGYDNDGQGQIQTLVEHWDGTSWQVITSPNVGASDLFGITALSASNVWAVGYSAFATQTLIEHWDGTQWSIVPSPSVGNNLNVLASVSAVSASDIWAVGWDYLGSNNPYRTLIEHWDGSKWSIVKSPNPGHAINRLYGVRAISSTDVWAVGGYSTGRSNYSPLAVHWDGTRWYLSPAHGKATTAFLAVRAISSTDVWAVGVLGTGAWSERWDGHRWRSVLIPFLLGGPLTAVVASSPSDVWAVGWEGGGIESVTVTLHWDGQHWTHIPSPSVEEAASQVYYQNYLSGVAMTSAHTLWAVGSYHPRNAPPTNTLIEYSC